MDDLLTWLRAELDTDEAHARKDLWCLDRATPTKWTAYYGYNLPRSRLVTDDGQDVAIFAGTDGPQYHESGLLIDGYEDRHQRDVMLVARLVNAARSRAEWKLADVAVKRRILDLHLRDGDGNCKVCCGQAYMEEEWDQEAQEEHVRWRRNDEPHPCRTVRLLAMPYAGRPGYRQDEWSP